MRLRWLAVLPVLFAWSAAAADIDGARNELAPIGIVRIGVIDQNPVIVVKDKETGKMTGLGVDLSLAFVRDLGRSLEIVGFGSGRELTEGMKAGRIDIGFLAYAPARAKDVAFTPPMIEVESSYMVLGPSSLKAIADVDAKGVKIGAIAKSSQDFHLTKTIKNATVVRIADGATAKGLEMLKSGAIDAFAGNTHRLSGALDKVPGARMMPGRFFKADYSMALPQGRPAAAAFATAFVERIKKDGTLAKAIAANKLYGVAVAPPAKAPSAKEGQ